MEHQRAVDKMTGKRVTTTKITAKTKEKIWPVRKGSGMGSLV